VRWASGCSMVTTVALFGACAQPGDGNDKLTHAPSIPSPSTCLIRIRAIVTLLSAR
jgi:hypothetical protein